MRSCFHFVLLLSLLIPAQASAGICADILAGIQRTLNPNAINSDLRKKLMTIREGRLQEESKFQLRLPKTLPFDGEHLPVVRLLDPRGHVFTVLYKDQEVVYKSFGYPRYPGVDLNESLRIQAQENLMSEVLNLQAVAKIPTARAAKIVSYSLNDKVLLKEYIKGVGFHDIKDHGLRVGISQKDLDWLQGIYRNFELMMNFAPSGVIPHRVNVYLDFETFTAVLIDPV